MNRLIAASIAGGMLFQGSNAIAADPSVMRVAVVPAAGQMSLVVEMSDETRRVSTQQLSATLLLVEAGPIALPLKRQILNAPSGLALLQRVSIDEATTGKEHVLRVGVTMKRSAPSTVRVVGRRIYIDFAVPDKPLAPDTLPTAASAAFQPDPRNTRSTTTGTGVASTSAAYRQVLSGATTRLEEIQPFLLSATSAPVPNPAVLNAVADAINGVQQSLRGVRPPAGGGPSFQLLVSATSLAAEAVSTSFHGDRASKAKQSMAVLAAAKAQLQ